MSSIHGTIFVIIGILMGGISLYKEELLIFRYASLVFIAYGVFKLLIKQLTTKSTSQPLKTEQFKQESQYSREQRLFNEQQTGFCKRCKSQISSFDNFCSYCGSKLR